MPTSIYMSEIMEVGKNLSKFGGNELPGNIRVEMYGDKMVIKENRVKVFTMKKVVAIDNKLLIDYPKTENGQNSRGWGMLGMFIALYYGLSQRCTVVDLGSQMEMTIASMAFWTKFGIAGMNNNPLSRAFDRGITWVLANCPQRDGKITDFVIR